MPWTKVGSTAVVVAQQFNPSIITQRWLERNRILADDDFQDGSLYSDVVVQVRSRPFQMLVVPDQLQIVPSVPPDQEQAELLRSLAKIVAELPHTPYRGLGLNFIWHLTPSDGDIARLSREMFYIPDRPLQRHFVEENCHYGGYFSKDLYGFRLKLDIKPLIVQLIGGRTENRLHFGFNYHCDLGEGAVQQIEEGLRHWDDARRYAERIIDDIEPRQQ